MADLPELDEWTPGVYQLETSDPVLGGPDGIDNRQAKQLASRTRWLRNQFQKLLDGVTSVGKATRLETARVLRFKGAATGSGSYDGSADTEITLTLTDSGVNAGSYTKVSLNAKGIAVGGSNPTTLEGYGITNALKTGVTSYQRPILAGLGSGSAAESGGAIEIREAQEVGTSNQSNAYMPRIMMHWTGVISGDIGMNSAGQLLWRGNKLYDASDFNFANKADKATTLNGYGITDAYNKVDTKYLIDQAVLPLATRLCTKSRETQSAPFGS